MAAIFYNVRGGTIRLSSDAPVYFGVGLEVDDSAAKKLVNGPLVKAYLESGSLVYSKNGKNFGSKVGLKRFSELYELAPVSAPKKTTKQKTKESDGDEL